LYSEFVTGEGLNLFGMVLETMNYTKFTKIKNTQDFIDDAVMDY